jgi:acyl transferase domain-containing protein
MGRRCVERESDAWLSSLRKGRGDWEQILESLAGLYVRGVAVDFKGFDRDYPRQKVALPTYPFERERYWVPARRGAPRPASAPQADRPAFADWLYETVWREAPLATHAVLPRTPVAVTAERPSIAAGRWIVLADEGGVGEALAARLREDGDDCTMVRTADRSEVSALGTVRIDPARPEEFRRLVQEIGSESWKGAVHLWGLDAPGADMPLALLDAEARVCGSLLHLVQAMVGAGRRGLCAVTRGAQRTEPGEAVVSVVPATLWGLGKVVALEHPGLASVCVDLDPAIGSAAAADLLFDELTHPDGEDQVAVRGGERRVARLARMEPASGTPSPSFAAAGTYLITGGLSGLGLLVARWMVTRGARHLVLLGRRGATEAAGPVLCEIEAAGAEVRSFAGDVADESRVRAILGEIDRSMPPLRGVVHAAGVLDDAVLEHQDWSRFERVLAPKVLGGWILHELTRTRPLDFFVLFSSGASLIGSPGQGNHAAANAFLDALAHHRRGLDLPALSINWGAWAEVGAAADRGLSVWMARRGMNGIAPHEGLDALGHLMSGGAAQVGVLNLDWAVLSSNLALASRFYSEMASPVAATGAQVIPGAPGARVDLLTRLEQARPAKRRAILCERVRGEAMKVLGLGPGRTLEADRPMQELGLDSLMAVELRNALGAALGRTLPAALLFDYPTLDRVVDYLLTEVLALVGSADVGEAAPASAPMSSESEALDDLSVDEMAALLAKRLDDVGEDRSR